MLTDFIPNPLPPFPEREGGEELPLRFGEGRGRGQIEILTLY